MDEKLRPRVGIAVFVFKDGQFLIGERRGSHGAGTWTVPGGHLEYGETFEQTAMREVEEEVGISIKNIRFAAVTNDVFEKEQRHYATIWLTSEYEGGEVRNLEPDKCLGWEWRDFETLPSPLFLAWQQLLPSEFMPELRARLSASQHA